MLNFETRRTPGSAGASPSRKLLAQIVEQAAVGFVAGFPDRGPRAARAGFAGGQRMGDSQLRAGVDSALVHERENRLHADLSGAGVAAAAVLHEGQRAADVAPVGRLGRP